jgi:hypothetical protein
MIDYTFYEFDNNVGIGIGIFITYRLGWDHQSNIPIFDYTDYTDYYTDIYRLNRLYIFDIPILRL